MLVPLVQPLHLFQVLPVVLEDYQILGLQITLQFIKAWRSEWLTKGMQPGIQPD